MCSVGPLFRHYVSEFVLILDEMPGILPERFWQEEKEKNEKEKSLSLA